MPRTSKPQPLVQQDELAREIKTILVGMDRHNAKVLAERLCQGYLNFADRVELHHGERSEEWSGLYVDGQLVTYGDNYHADESIRYHLLGITHVQGDDGDDWLGGTSDTPLQTTAEVRAYRGQRQTKEAESADLIRQAAELEAKAAAIRAQAAS